MASEHSAPATVLLFFHRQGCFETSRPAALHQLCVILHQIPHGHCGKVHLCLWMEVQTLLKAVNLAFRSMDGKIYSFASVDIKRGIEMATENYTNMVEDHWLTTNVGKMWKNLTQAPCSHSPRTSGRECIEKALRFVPTNWQQFSPGSSTSLWSKLPFTLPQICHHNYFPQWQWHHFI